MKKAYKRGMTLLFLGIFLVSTLLLAGSLRDKRRGTSAYQEAVSIAVREESVTREVIPSVSETVPPEVQWVPETIPKDPVMDDLAQIDLAALREVNPDVVGWIIIPDTDINYPLMQGEDDDFYLNHTWKGDKNSVGSIFLEYLCSPDLTGDNTIIYGHNMANGSMFADLRNYAVKDFWKRSPFVYIVTDEGIFRYDIIAAYKADVDSLTYGVEFPTEDSKANFLRYIRQESEFDTGIVPQVQDRILTLSTCYGTANEFRWVVQARLRMVPV
jgi:sortase B